MLGDGVKAEAISVSHILINALWSLGCCVIFTICECTIVREVEI